MKTIQIEICENDTANTGTYKVWFTASGVKQFRTLSENDTDSLLSMNQKEDFFMGKYKFRISETELKYKLK